MQDRPDGLVSEGHERQPKKPGAEKQEAGGLRGCHDGVDPQGGVNGAIHISAGEVQSTSVDA